jgi:hypothetical protein
MTANQILKFKTGAKFHKMTVRDYENWLLLYHNNPQDLDKTHREKLRVLLKGGRLDVRDLPDAPLAFPLTAEEQFHKNYPGYITELPQSEPSGLQQAYNVGDYDEYMQPENLKHLATYNPDEPLKEHNDDDIRVRPVVTLHAGKHKSD